MHELEKKYLKLLNPGMGTENVGPLIYNLIQIIRPTNVLEVGLGYSTALIAEGLFKSKTNFEEERKSLFNYYSHKKYINKEEMSYIKNLNPEYYVKSYKPIHICIDDFSVENSNAKLVLNELKKNNLLEQIFLIKSDFRKKSKEIQDKFGKINFIWFDCGGPLEYQDFINEYWSIVEKDGYLIFHFTFSYTFEISNFENNSKYKMGKMIKNENYNFIYEKIKNDLYLFLNKKKMKYEVISIIEPHKQRQSSITIVKKLP